MSLKSSILSIFSLFLFLFFYNIPSTNAALNGDGNSDGKVDESDYLVWLNHFNQNVFGPANGDFNASGAVDGIDYVIWLNNYGSIATPAPTVFSTPTPSATPTASPVLGYTRPFNANSIWNKPISQSGQTVAPNSAQMVAIMVQENEAGVNIPITIAGAGESWSIPVYFADSSTPKKNVCGLNDDSSLNACTFGLMPVATNFYPAWDGGNSSPDHKIAIIDTTNNHGWSGWAFAPSTRTYQGQEVHYTFRYGAYGWTDTSINGDGVTMHDGGAWGGRANALSYLGGLIWPEEIQAGQINHALALSMSGSAVSQNTRWWPSRSGDGYSNDPNAVPYGARIQLNPAFDVNTLPAGAPRIIAKALQIYGAWVVDTGGSIGIYGREFVGANGTGTDTTPWKNVGVSSSYVVRNLIPWNQLQVLTQANQANFYMNP